MSNIREIIGVVGGIFFGAWTTHQLGFLSHLQWTCSCQSSPTTTNKNNLSPTPNLPFLETNFANETLKYSVSSIPWPQKEWEDMYMAWEALNPRGRGFVNISHPARFHGLPVPIQDFKDPPEDGVYRYGMAVFHQLHCLFILQRYFYETNAGLRPLIWHTIFHYNHCVDYLRQTIMCHADTTLEGQDPEQTERGDASGLGDSARHVCRDYEQLYDWAEKNRWYDLKSLDHDIAEGAKYDDWQETWQWLGTLRPNPKSR